MSVYLDVLKHLDISPNFWCSEKYWKQAGWEEKPGKGESIIVIDKKTKEVMLPPVHFDLGVACPAKYWAGFSVPPPEACRGNFLDYEFIYRPSNFLDLPGKKWRKVRKNIQWVLNRHGLIHGLSTENNQMALVEFLECWANQGSEGDSGEDWYEPEVTVNYLLDMESNLLFWGDLDFKVRAVCLWDENWKYVNFRYCLVDPDITGLSDYIRVEFYREINRLRPGKLVNDGGTLDRDSLYRYKTKLNPVEINSIYGGLR